MLTPLPTDLCHVPLAIRSTICVQRRCAGVNRFMSNWILNNLMMFWLKILIYLIKTRPDLYLLAHKTICFVTHNGIVVWGSDSLISFADVRIWTTLPTYMGAFFILYSVYKPGVKVGMLKGLRLHTHGNENDAVTHAWHPEKNKFTSAITESRRVWHPSSSFNEGARDRQLRKQSVGWNTKFRNMCL
jgi:hypothetical protein